MMVNLSIKLTFFVIITDGVCEIQANIPLVQLLPPRSTF